MTGSYFELLTEQQGFPAKPFDPLEELKLLRQRLSLRMEAHGISAPAVEVFEFKGIAPPLTRKREPVSLESLANTMENVKETLAIVQPIQEQHCHQECTRPVPSEPVMGFSRDIHAVEEQGSENRSQISAVIVQNLGAPQEKLLNTFNVAMTALGIIGVVFGMLSFSRGWEGDLPLGSWISASGGAIIALGLGGRFFASRTEQKITEPQS